MSLLLHRCRVPAPSLHFRLGFLSIILLGVGIINLNRLLIMATTLQQNLEGTPQISHFTCDSCNPQTFTFLIENKDFSANEPPFLLIISTEWQEVAGHSEELSERKGTLIRDCTAASSQSLWDHHGAHMQGTACRLVKL